MEADIKNLLDFIYRVTNEIGRTINCRFNVANWAGVGKACNRCFTKEAVVIIVDVKACERSHLNNCNYGHKEIHIFEAFDHLKEAIDSEAVFHEKLIV